MTKRGSQKRKRRTTAASPEAQEPATATTASAEAPERAPKRARTFDERWKTATTSNEVVLEKQMETWHSDVYEHFAMPPEIVLENGAVKYRFWCRKYPDEHITRARTDPSTSNLNSHVEVCDPDVPDSQGLITNFAHGSTYSKARFRYLTTVWVSTCFRPFAIVEDAPLLAMFKMLYAQVDVPSADTVSRDVKETFKIAQTAVKTFLQSQKAAIHIAFDGWTAPNVISYLGVVVIFEQSGQLTAFLLDFIRLRKRHTGRYLAQEMHQCLDTYGISDKIYAQAADNASNNDTMIEALGGRLNGHSGPQTRIRCLSHVLNLCVKGILEPFVKAKKKRSGKQRKDAPGSGDDMSRDEDQGGCDDGDNGDDEDDEDQEDEEDEEDDNYELDPDREASDQATLDAIAQSGTAPVSLDDHERLFAQKTLTKVHALTKKIFHSPVLREDLDELCHKRKVPSLGVIRSVPTRWNSVAMTSKRTIQLRGPLTDLVSKACHNESRGPRLLRFKLSTEEWVILEQLEAILAHFLEATLRMSAKQRPLLHEVIPVIDLLESMLARTVANTALMPAVRVAASYGQAILNKYYEKTDDSVMYRCAILLHPKHKTSYFKRQKWPQLWIDTALDVLRDEWARYKPAPRAAADEPESSERGLFATLDDDFSSTGTDALEDYLISPPIPTVSDPIMHWHALDSARNPLARMALDILSAPATSVDAERSFSHGGLTVSKLRHNLSDESTRAATVLSAWMKVPNLVPEAKIIQTFADKASRSKVVPAGASTDSAINVE